MILGIVQIALWSHAGAIAQGAADHGAEVAGSFGSNDAEGVAAAIGFANNAGMVSSVTASATDGGELVTINVGGSYPSVFGTLQITASSTAVRERPPG